MTDLDLSRVWVVDPASGRDGPGDIVVRDGVLEAVTWLDGSDADGVEPTGVVVGPLMPTPLRLIDSSVGISIEMFSGVLYFSKVLTTRSRYGEGTL